MSEHLRTLSQLQTIPQEHIDYLYRMRDEMGVDPGVIYDIGACVLEWANLAQEVWPDAEIIVFDGMRELRDLYQDSPFMYHIGVLGKQDRELVTFWRNVEYPWGNSVFRENPELSPHASWIFDENSKTETISMTLDTVVKENHFPMPDLIKVDVQGSEKRILTGGMQTFAHCRDLIVELQHAQYNLGASLAGVTISALQNSGFKMVTPGFAASCEHDADYHFRRWDQE